MFDAIGRHAIGELIDDTSQQIIYNPVSKDTGNFTSLNFNTR